MHKKYIRTCSLAILSINSLRSKREFLEPLIRNHFDIFLVSQMILDSSFTGSDYTIPGYILFRKDRNQHGGGLIFIWTRILLVKLLIHSIFQIVTKSIQEIKRYLLLAAINLCHLMINIFGSITRCLNFL